LAKIEESWSSEFSITSIDEAKEKVKELETEIESDKKKLEKQYEKLDSIVDWDNV
jgi:tetrahydromethanopterin S-methyltransferase subunit B